jgi:outer membrane protein TolC
MNYGHFFRIAAIAGLAVLCAAPHTRAADLRHLTLAEAVRLAVSQNRALRIARLKIDENQQKKAGDRSAYFPKITNESSALHITELQNILIPAGGLGAAGGALIPAQAVNLQQG